MLYRLLRYPVPQRVSYSSFLRKCATEIMSASTAKVRDAIGSERAASNTEAYTWNGRQPRDVSEGDRVHLHDAMHYFTLWESAKEKAARRRLLIPARALLSGKPRHRRLQIVRLSAQAARPGECPRAAHACGLVAPPLISPGRVSSPWACVTQERARSLWSARRSAGRGSPPPLGEIKEEEREPSREGEATPRGDIRQGGLPCPGADH